MFKNLLKKIKRLLSIDIQKHLNENFRTYHSTTRKRKFSDSHIQQFAFPFYFHEDEAEITELGERGIRLLHGLTKISGIKTIWIKEYLISVKKKEFSSWEEIEPQVLDLLMNS